VKEGDTLTRIAKNYLGSAERYKELAELNKLKVNTVDGIDYV
jgi:nucleoid-associated protein YgaU